MVCVCVCVCVREREREREIRTTITNTTLGHIFRTILLASLAGGLIHNRFSAGEPPVPTYLSIRWLLSEFDRICLTPWLPCHYIIFSSPTHFFSIFSSCDLFQLSLCLQSAISCFEISNKLFCQTALCNRTST